MAEELPDLLAGDRPRGSVVVRLALVGAAAACFVLGVVFWLVPIVTGIPFYVLGLVLLAAASSRARRLVNRLERRLPAGARVKLRELVQRHGRRAATP
jgi:Flp pilus assembly protein TadB